MIPQRIQRTRQHKNISPNELGTIYVGRPSMWGNPFKLMGDMIYVNASHRRKVFNPWVLYDQNGGHTIDDVVKLFSDLMYDLSSHEVEEPICKRFRLMRDRIKDLGNKNLSCWCKIGSPCHGDVLLKFVNHFIL